MNRIHTGLFLFLCNISDIIRIYGVSILEK